MQRSAAAPCESEPSHDTHRSRATSPAAGSARKPAQPLAAPSTAAGGEHARRSARLRRGAGTTRATAGLAQLLALDFQQRAARLKALAKYLNEQQGSALRDLGATPARRAATAGSTSKAAPARCSPTPAIGGNELPSGNVVHEGPAVPLGKKGGFAGTHILVPRARRRGAHQRLQLPGLGPAREVRADLPRRHAVHRQAGHRDQLPHRGAGAADRTSRACCREGSLQLVIGGTGDLLDRLDGQDVVTFTGSADTAAKLRVHPNLRARSRSRSTPRPIRSTAPILGARRDARRRGVRPVRQGGGARDDGEGGAEVHRDPARDRAAPASRRGGRAGCATRLAKIVVGDPARRGRAHGRARVAGAAAPTSPSASRSCCRAAELVYGARDGFAPVGEGVAERRVLRADAAAVPRRR